MFCTLEQNNRVDIFGGEVILHRDSYLLTEFLFKLVFSSYFSVYFSLFATQSGFSVIPVLRRFLSTIPTFLI